MNDHEFTTATDNDLERAFIEDYAHFALQLNPTIITTLVTQATNTTDQFHTKLYAAAGLQLLYTSIEDFAILLHAIIQRKNGTPLHLLLSTTTKQGSTAYPKLLKEHSTALGVLTALGLTTITADRLQDVGYAITNATINDPFNDFAPSINALANDAKNVNTLKNRLKHGKAIFGHTFGLHDTHDIGHLEEEHINNHASLGMITTEASREQLRTAAIKTCKISIRAIDLLALVTIHYHSTTAAQQVQVLHNAAQHIVQLANAVGLTAPGLHA